jgi:hypothetical protein
MDRSLPSPGASADRRVKAPAIAAIVNGALSRRTAPAPSTASTIAMSSSEITIENKQIDSYRFLKETDGI